MYGGLHMPTLEEVTNVLSSMDKEKYSAAVSFIYYLVSNSQSGDSTKVNQQRFIDETAGKISVDEAAINSLRMGSMI